MLCSLLDYLGDYLPAVGERLHGADRAHPVA